VTLSWLLVTLAATSPFTTGDSLTVRGVIARARAHAPQVLAALEATRSAQHAARAAQRNAAPQLRLRSGALIAPEGFYDPALTNLGEYDLRLVGTLPLLDGGARRRGRERAGLDLALSSTDLAAGARDVALEAARLAISVLQTGERSRRRQETMRWASDVLRVLRSGSLAGVRSPSDVARLGLGLQAVASDLAALERQRTIDGHALGTLLNPDSLGTLFTAVRDTAWTESAPTPEDSIALLRRFLGAAEVGRAEADVRVARLEIANARGRGALTLDATADAGLWGSDLTHAVPPDFAATHPGATFSDRLRRDLGASIAFEMSLPLIQPGNANLVDAREADLRAAEFRLEAARREAAQAAFDLLARWRSAAGLLAMNRETATLAEAHERRVHSLYLAGSVSLLELLDARNVLEDAQDRLEDVRGDLHMALLEAEIGR
jgi:cobalt-zinc-cadmium efflux system outer membrane protein